MFKFLPNKAPVFKALKAPFLVRKSKQIKKLFFYLFFIPTILWVLAVFQSDFKIISGISALGWILFFFFGYFLFWYINLFFIDGLKNNPAPLSLEEANANIENINFAQFFDYEAAKLLDKTIKSKSKDSVTLFYYLLKKDFSHFIFSRLLIDKSDLLSATRSLKGKVRSKEISDSLKSTITMSLAIAVKRGGERIRPEDLLVSLADNDQYFREILIKKDLKVREIRSLAFWYVRIKKREEEDSKFWKYQNLIKIGSIGKQWASGASYNLDKYAVDWTEKLSKKGFRKIVGYKNAIKSLERVLSADSKNNAIIVGKPGTGRRSLIDELTRRSFFGFSIPGVNHKRVYKLNLQSLIAKVEGKEQTEKEINKIFKEVAKVGNIILVINNLHEYISGNDKTGVVDISGILDSYLAYRDFRLVGITNYADYRGTIEKNKAISSGLKKIEINEIEKEETEELCQMITPSLEKKYKIFISYQSIKAAVELAEKYLTGSAFPEKAMNLLEEAIIATSQKKKKVLEKKDIAQIVSEKAEVPVGKAVDEEKKVLLNLEEEIHKRLINQNQAVNEVAKSLRRSRAEIDTRTGLIGSFLFLGPTGVGKTEMAKSIADIYFGSENKMIRIDMSEYQNISDISRLIGSETKSGVLTEQVIEDPFSLILLDELEKAHKNILNLFLQILDEGHVTDGVGRKVSFKNCMVIATSNAGYKIIMDSVRESIPLEKIKQQIMDHIFKKGLFRPEFVNRFDGTVVFKPLSKDNLMDIADLELKKLKNNLTEKHIDFIITDELKEKIVDMSYEPVFGAREMQRVIQNNVGDSLASALLSDTVEAGDKIIIDPDGFSIKKINN
jgi:ATP-dependent Clp protease ATP-binding subunit ClpC